jgi:hypothetical protein
MRVAAKFPRFSQHVFKTCWGKLWGNFTGHFRVPPISILTTMVDNETKFALGVTERLRQNDPTLKRIDISAKLFRIGNFDAYQIRDFLYVLGQNTILQTIHLSGTDLEDNLTDTLIQQLFAEIAKLKQLRELFVFRGNCLDVSETNLALALKGATGIKVLMLWEFGTLGDNPDLAGALRSHPSLERVTLTLPGEMPYGYLDVYVLIKKVNFSVLE